MLRLDEILDVDALERLIAERYVSRTRHPTAPLSILDYTNLAQLERRWTPETVRCRGLVVRDDGIVVARPLDKFFNLDELPQTQRDALPEGPLEVTDKIDGSLVVLRAEDGRLAASTRGSFCSEQALGAAAWLGSRAVGELDPDVTVCAEYVSPRHRIVLDYGEREEVIVLAARRISDGSELSRPELERLAEHLGLPIVPYRAVDSLGAVLDEAERAAGVEGWVVRWPDGLRAKIKTEEYRRLHRSHCYLTPVMVRDALIEDDLSPLLLMLPEETWEEIHRIAAEITARVDRALADVDRRHAALLAQSDGTRKGYAALAHDQPDARALFLRFGGRDPRKELLRTVDLSGIERVWTALRERQGGTGVREVG